MIEEQVEIVVLAADIEVILAADKGEAFAELEDEGSKMLEQTGWNRVRAARALRISYRALLYKIKQAGLDGERSTTRSAPQAQL